MKLFFLFNTFFRTGLLAVGGGLATLPFVFEVADNSGGWLTREMVGNMLAVAQSSPGAIGANLSAYVGLQYAGIPGAYMAALALIAPSIIIITVIARMLAAFKESPIVKSLFAGFRPAAAGLLSAACFGAIALSLWNASSAIRIVGGADGPTVYLGAASAWYEFIRWKEALIFAALFFLIYKFKKHPVIYIFAAGVAGVVLGL